jgi:hypothetical protein
MVIHPSIRKELERQKLEQLIAEARYQPHSRATRAAAWLKIHLAQLRGGTEREKSWNVGVVMPMPLQATRLSCVSAYA